ncbi:hypothetical protein [Bradyrhizobium macuxiense]|uniref:hypothetical protein n=1 Tax=Bradyrhizobium macuxiense TaxID=1755647 RepID=UPI001FDA7A13|nr:hypothetical protein [Bradyrhizobium macuxiense]
MSLFAISQLSPGLSVLIAERIGYSVAGLSAHWRQQLRCVDRPHCLPIMYVSRFLERSRHSRLSAIIQAGAGSIVGRERADPAANIRPKLDRPRA